MSAGRLRRILWRAQEKAVLGGYRAASWTLGHLPPGPTLAFARPVFLASYCLWPAKRRIVEENAGHILGLPPEHPEARRLARRIYSAYARYIVDLMRLPWQDPRAASGSFTPRVQTSMEEFARLYERLRAEGRATIVASVHMGSIEAFTAALAGREWPIYGVADDSAYPELYELLARQRQGWGVQVIAWRNLREVFRVLRQGAMLALLVDWGYRDDGIPVRLFGDWTTLPAGPATLAGKTGAAIVAVANWRRSDGLLDAAYVGPILVRDTSPAEIARATQEMASALERLVRSAPEQWTTFKPMWPATAAEVDGLAARAAESPAGAAAEAGAGGSAGLSVP